MLTGLQGADLLTGYDGDPGRLVRDAEVVAGVAGVPAGRLLRHVVQVQVLRLRLVHAAVL